MIFTFYFNDIYTHSFHYQRKDCENDPYYSAERRVLLPLVPFAAVKTSAAAVYRYPF